MSEMHQAMDSWLKTECIEVGQDLFATHYNAEVILDVIHKCRDKGVTSISRIKEIILAVEEVIESDWQNNRIDEHHYRDLVANLYDITQSLPTEESIVGLKPGLIDRFTAFNNATNHTILLLDKLQTVAFEKVVECQCGKPSLPLPVSPSIWTIMDKDDIDDLYKRGLVTGMERSALIVELDERGPFNIEGGKVTRWEEPPAPERAKPPDRSNLMFKWHLRGEEAGKTETWMDVENTIKDTASRHPEITDAHELVWSDIEQWEGTDHFTISYVSKMWEDAKTEGEIDTALYSDIKSEFWNGYLDGRRSIGKDIYAIANELIGGGTSHSSSSTQEDIMSELKGDLDRQITDEFDANRIYTEMSERAKMIGRDDIADKLSQIAADESKHRYTLKEILMGL